MYPSRRLLYQSLYKARKTWPPDFSKLTEKHKFSLERRYRRRTQLKYARPRLHQTVRLIQWSAFTFTMIYGVMWAPWPKEYNAFTPLREWVKSTQESFWSTSSNGEGKGSRLRQ